MNLSELPLADEIFFAGPQDPADAEAWRAGLKAWRADRAIRLRYDGSQYDRPELAWTQQVFSQVQLLIWDRSFYDPETGEYTVDRFLAETESRIGPIDAVLIWHVYPNLGVDDRNQFDLLRDLPGGVPALRQMVDKFHQPRGEGIFPDHCLGHAAPAKKARSPGSRFRSCSKTLAPTASISTRSRAFPRHSGRLPTPPAIPWRWNRNSIFATKPGLVEHRMERLGHLGRQGISLRARW